MRDANDSKPKSNSRIRDAISPDVGNPEMTPPTEAKVRAIRLALDATGDEIHNSYVALLLAMLTSSNKIEREVAKKQVRAYVAQGEQRRIANEEAAGLADFANRHEP